MHLAIALVTVVAAVVAVSGVCGRFDLPAPLVLIPLGVAASYVPVVPEVHLSTELVLVGFLPPLLYSTALQSSLVDFHANRVPILMLSVGLVAFTAVGVGVVVHGVLPGVSWPASFALGAVVAPPDAVAATSIGRRIGLPRRVVTVLEGESLLNDATALVALSTAVGAAGVGTITVLDVGVDFLLAAGVGLVAGLATYLVVGWVRKQLTEPVLDASISLLAPFAAYVAAEEGHGSGILAVVVAGLLLGHRAPILQTASSRIAERLNWRTISFLLENSVFLLIGLQARRIIENVAGSGVSGAQIIIVCAVALVATMVLRLVWVVPSRFLVRRTDRGTGRESSWRDATVIGWAGMRGVVTLAAAFAIPDDFPKRDVLVLVALVVMAGTLFIQGSSLPWMARRLRLQRPDAREDALARASLFQEASQAGLGELEKHDAENDPHGTLKALRDRVEQRDFAAWERLGEANPESETPSEAYARLRLEMLRAERGQVLEVRSTGRVAHDVIEDVLTSLDVEESMLDTRQSRRYQFKDADTDDRPTHSGRDVPCEHMEAAPTDTAPDVDGACEDCIRKGTSWVHLRLCLECGHMGCCDSSPRRHAAAHFHDSEHPVIRSAEAGEVWRWCYVDNRLG